MKANNTNISSLLSSLNTSSPLSSINIGDYATIKSGSYKKLLKAYYDEQKDTSTESVKKASKKNEAAKASVDSTGLSTIKKDAEKLKASAEALGNNDLWEKTDGQYDMDKISDAVKTFTNDYNAVIEQSAKVTSKDVSTDVKYMSSLSNTLSKSLSKIGVTVGADGKLSLNEDTLKKANASDVKELFTGTVSFGSQIEEKAGSISKDAVMNSSIYGSNGAASSILSGMFNEWM